MSKTGAAIETIGPFLTEDYRVSIDGYEVPNIRLIKKSGAQDGIVTVILDNLNTNHPEVIPPCPKCGSLNHCAIGEREYCHPGQVCDLMLCEQKHVLLRPGILYRFRASTDCDECKRLAEEVPSAEPEGTRFKAGSEFPKSEWIPVSERLPEGDEVIYWDGGMVSTFFLDPSDLPENQAKRIKFLGITHWMPMPDPPSSPSSPLPEAEDSAPKAQPRSERTKSPTGQAEQL